MDIENQFIEDDKDNLFQIFEERGIGSLKSSRIFFAEQIKYARPVCLKLAMDDRSFEREHRVLEELVKSMAEARRNNGSFLPVIPVSYGYGKIINFEGKDWNYLVRDYFSGISLTNAFRQEKPFPINQRIHHVIEAMCQAALYISYFHQRGKYHGEIKPDDFVINKRGKVFLVDYETVLNEGAMNNDNHPVFSAPEKTGLIESIPPGKTSDIYSLAMSFFALLLANNKPAYTYFLSGQCLRYELLERTDSDFNLKIPIEIMQVLHKATSFEPSERYHSLDEFISALKKAKVQ